MPTIQQLYPVCQEGRAILTLLLNFKTPLIVFTCPIVALTKSLVSLLSRGQSAHNS